MRSFEEASRSDVNNIQMMLLFLVGLDILFFLPRIKWVLTIWSCVRYYQVDGKVLFNVHLKATCIG